MAVLDTSFLAALMDCDDRFHKEAKAIPLHGDRLVVPWEIWLEFAQLMLRSTPEAQRVLESVRDGPFDIQQLISSADLQTLVALEPRVRRELARRDLRPLSLFDLIVCLIAQRHRDRILTFDQGIVEAIRLRLFPGARIG